MKINNFIGFTLSGLVGGLLVLGVGYFGEPNQNITRREDVQTKGYFHNVSSTKAELPNLTNAAEEASPGVVHIKIFKHVSSMQRSNDPFEEFYREFFGDRYQRETPRSGESELRLVGSGSGVIISDDGYIATNNHVINGADKIEIVLNDKRSFTGELVGTDPTTDLALVKIEANGLRYLKYGNSDEIKVGEWVLAVGNPFDLTSTVTAGIISAKARSINILRNESNSLAIESFLQTDAAVNPGNSGGALVDVEGRLVGINTAIASPTGAYAGYSFAVPVMIVKKVMKDLKEFGAVQRALLGVEIGDVTSELAKEKNLGEVRGVYVGGVREGGAGEEAGLKEGDVIIEIEGVKVSSASELQEIIVRYRPGDEINLKYLRDGNTVSTKTALKNKLGTTKLIEKSENSVVEFLGAEFISLTDNEKAKYKVRSGVKVIKVGEGKLREKNVPKGFVILKVADKYVSQPSEIIDILSNTSGGVLVEGLLPDGRRAYFALSL